MHKTQVHTPVVLTVFNRPDVVRRVFATIRNARPTKLFLIADGPRTADERALCEAARAEVAVVDWECDVYTNFSETNMGAKYRLSTGITWVFEHVDRAIILEHDCLPHPDFFPYCGELLEKFIDDERIMHINGDNFHANNTKFVCNESYFFSNIPHSWGWATWRRAWKHYDVELSLWPEVAEKKLLSRIFTDPAVAAHWEYLFSQYHAKKIESWDGQWGFACFINRGLCITPTKNLISNIGFGPGALTTTDPSSELAHLPTEALPLPLNHPNILLPDLDADAYIYRNFFKINYYWTQRVLWHSKQQVPQLYTWVRSIYRSIFGYKS